MAPLVKEFQNHPNYFETKVCVTAQHREMLDQVLEIFEIQPDFDLNIMKPGQDLYDITANVLLGLRQVLDSLHPDLLLVHGDTSTTFAASLAAFYKKIPVGHVEAGLRTGDIYSPWPEEANRQLTTQITAFHFAPTSTSQENLVKENVSRDKILISGNTVIDALFLMIEKIKTDSEYKKSILKSIQKDLPLDIENIKYVLITGHRRENFGEGFLNICKALKQIAQANPDIHIIYPVHLNPNVQKPVNDILADETNIHLIKPQEYQNFVMLMYFSHIILTDSGGVQEEAPSLGKPVLVMRNTTERPEAVEAGTVKLVGTDHETIIRETEILLNNSEKYMMMSKAHNPYGDGKACERIVEFVKGNIHA